LLNFSRGGPIQAAQKDGQDLPVRQTLPPASADLNGVKTQ
jgi:hypothetical protein